MPALPRDKILKRVQTPTRYTKSIIHPRSLSNTDVKRLGPSRRISSKRAQTQSIQTQTVLACLMLNETSKRLDEGTQTNGDTDDYSPSLTNGFTSRLVQFFGGTIVSFMRIFHHFK